MTNKNIFIVPNPPYKNLSKTSIDLFYILQTYQQHLEIEGRLNKDKYFSISNIYLANIIERTPFTVSKCIKKLERENFLILKYIPDGHGLIRKIYINAN